MRLHPDRRGIALSLVLWCLAFLAGLVILTGGVVRGWLESESQAEKRFVARQMALNGVALGLHPAMEPGHPLLRHGDRESEGYEVVLDSEAAKVNPNYWIAQGNRKIFHRLFAAWGANLTASDAAIDALQDWMDADDLLSLKGAERGEYERAGRPGFPPNEPLRHVREMEAVLNLAPLLAGKEDWQGLFTIWYSGKVSLQHADEPLLTALAELTPLQCQSLRELRAGADGIEDTADDLRLESVESVADFLGAGPNQRAALEEFFDTSGNMRRIESTGWCGGVRHTITVIAPEDAPGRIMSWEEK